jgi:hypothetical protein
MGVGEQIDASHQLHREKELPLVVDELTQADEIRMVDALERPEFILEANDLLRPEARQKLQRDRAVMLAVIRLENDAHAAGADGCEQAKSIGSLERVAQGHGPVHHAALVSETEPPILPQDVVGAPWRSPRHGNGRCAAPAVSRILLPGRAHRARIGRKIDESSAAIDDFRRVYGPRRRTVEIHAIGGIGQDGKVDPVQGKVGVGDPPSVTRILGSYGVLPPLAHTRSTCALRKP